MNVHMCSIQRVAAREKKGELTASVAGGCGHFVDHLFSHLEGRKLKFSRSNQIVQSDYLLQLFLHFDWSAPNYIVHICLLISLVSKFRYISSNVVIFRIKEQLKRRKDRERNSWKCYVCFDSIERQI